MTLHAAYMSFLTLMSAVFLAPTEPPTTAEVRVPCMGLTLVERDHASDEARPEGPVVEIARRWFPAADAGVREGAVITAVDGQRIQTVADFERAINDAAAAGKSAVNLGWHEPIGTGGWAVRWQRRGARSVPLRAMRESLREMIVESTDPITGTVTASHRRSFQERPGGEWTEVAIESLRSDDSRRLRIKVRHCASRPLSARSLTVRTGDTAPVTLQLSRAGRTEYSGGWFTSTNESTIESTETYAAIRLLTKPNARIRISGLDESITARVTEEERDAIFAVKAWHAMQSQHDPAIGKPKD